MLNEETKGTYNYWLITRNNPPEPFEDACEKFYEALQPTWFKGQVEKGEQGTPHIQALLYYKTKGRVSQFKEFKLHAIGVSKRDAILKVQKYVTKDESRLFGPFEFGNSPFKEKTTYSDALDLAKRGDLENISPDILIRHFGNLQKIVSAFSLPLRHDTTRGIWITGPPGYGKSHYAREHFGESIYYKAQNKWFDGYQSQDTIIIDDMDEHGRCLSHYLKIWADKWECYGEIKGGKVALRHKNLVVTSNYTIDQLWEDQILIDAISRRFKLIIAKEKFIFDE